MEGHRPLAIKVGEALDTVRSYVTSEGWNVELVEIVNGVVRLRLQPNCDSSPSSSLPVKRSVQEAINAAAPDVVAIEINEVSESPAHRLQSVDPLDAAWEEVRGLSTLADGSIEMVEVNGRTIVFCRLGESLYAYGSSCPSCGRPFAEAYLQLTHLVCSHCGERYDVISAGRGLGQPALHLEKLRLSLEDGRTRVALPRLKLDLIDSGVPDKAL